MREVVSFVLLSLFFILFDGSSLAKPQSAFAEYHILSIGGQQKIVVAYQLFFRGLIFSRDRNRLNGKYSVTVDLLDSSLTAVKSEFVEKTLALSAGDDEENGSVQGLIMTDNLIGVRSLGIIFTDESSGREIRKLHLFFPPAAQDREDVYIVNDMPVSGGSDQFQLTNLDGVIPYSARNYSLIISSSQTFRSVPSFEFRGFDSVFVKTPDRIVTGELLMEQSNEKIQLSLDTNKRGKTYFIFYNISNVLFPGTYQCQMQKGIDSCSEKNLSLRVAWLDAPMTFLHPLSAAKMLQLVDELIDKSYLNDIDSSQTALFKFWKKYDPTAATSFNELMAEFYRRGDYAMEHFSTLKGNDGIETDRGKIYIKYGKPSQIRRDMNSQNKVIEIWIYKNGITYYLVDKTGTGDFELVGAP